jgi:uncharacterized hydrophobic protein (TIGR00271 family)
MFNHSPKLISGQFSDTESWRVLVLLSPGDRLGLVGEFAADLARANRGELYLAVIYPEGNPVEQSVAQATLNDIGRSSGADHFEIAGNLLLEAPANNPDILQRFLKENSIDFLLIRADSQSMQYINSVTCPFGVLRGEQDILDRAPAEQNIAHILIPTSGGPNTLRSFEFLLPMATKLEKDVTALYVARDNLSEEDLRDGEATLNQALSSVDADEHVRKKVISARSVIDALTDEAAQAEYDLVVLGANESAVERLIFGNIVDSVVRLSRKPVLVIRQPHRAGESLANRVTLRARRFMPQLDTKKRTEVYVRIRRNSRPSTDFYVLITLSAAIAALGLNLNSPAVVIGAMLVAPLMSPIVGLGMAMVYGDTRFLRIATISVARGVLLAFLVGILVGLTYQGSDLSAEVLARTNPTLPDLGVALFSGLAGAYALCYSQAAGALPGVAIAAALVPPIASSGIALSQGRFPESVGALFLFFTNLVVISTASAFIFFVLGFRPMAREKQKQATRTRSVRIAFILLAINIGILSYSTISLTREQRELAVIRSTTESVLNSIDDEGTTVELDDLVITYGEDDPSILNLDITARSTRNILYSEVVAIQEQIGATLRAEGIDFSKLAVNMVVIRITQLDPANPPTPTPTVMPTSTVLPVLPASSTAVVSSADGLILRIGPTTNSPIMMSLPPGTVVLLTGETQQDESEQMWQEVRVAGQRGWVLANFLLPIEPAE